MKFVIMAGGGGTKLWPLSKIYSPKQFINIIGEKTLFRRNLEALLSKYSPDDIFISTNEEYIHFVEEQAPEVSSENYIIEPSPRNSGPACIYAMAKVAHRYPKEVVMFYVQPVVIREPKNMYLTFVKQIEDIVKRTGILCTGGIIPKYPELGSDYIKLGEKFEMSNLETYYANGFVNFVKERMNIDQANKLVNDRSIAIHTNHYTWLPSKLFEAVKELRPDWYKILLEIQSALGEKNEYEKIKEIFLKFEPGRMEELTSVLFNEGKVLVTMLPFDWAHITTWDDVYNYKVKNNIPLSNTKSISVEGENNLLYSKNNKLITTVGVSDFVVIETDDEILIMPRKEAGKLPLLNDEIEKKNPQNL